MLQYSHVQNEYGETFISDHAPMILNFQSRDHNIKAPFRFFNVWADHPNFMPIIEKEWRMQTNQGRMKRIWDKLKSLRPQLRHLNDVEVKGITMKIDQARAALKVIQQQMHQQYTNTLAASEKECLLKLEKWSLIEDGVLRQMSRITWIKQGYSNTKYFSAIVKEKKWQKQIVEINALAGGKLTNKNAIREEIISIYKSLMGTTSYSLPAVSREILKKGPVLNHQQQIELCA
ncbi:PREDICTED: uncharacterized protein LOC109206700 [Nicotiana attenuata]|uniref:uncharacterized protein LOC109206700 n=1 Tax=Nicotiana attenuata TaxID=49451 RepID=UPI000905BDED|nr:PREDICTED: uncharacterized protein LOC109206700 [Nicotiana attenuata]XP_019225098.1 PREDICTED: uncharacterized protein LOC109206700 [Nicotiana attenuata]